ncbi:uncharacterized protein LOC144987867 [Oryzias latipes]
MSSLQSLRELISERLAAAAEEICRLCEGTIVQYEQELCRQRRLLDVIWKPQLQLHHIALPQHWMTEEEDQCNQQRNFKVEQEEPEHPQTKEEPGEVFISQDEDQIDRKQETDTLMEIPTYEEDENSEADLNNQQRNFRVEHEEPEPSQTEEEQGEQQFQQIKEEPEPPQIKEESGELCISQDDQLDLKQETDTLMEIPTFEEDENSEADLNNQQSFNVTDSHDGGNQHVESTSTTDEETESTSTTDEETESTSTTDEETESTSTTDEETDPQNRDQRKKRDRSHVQTGSDERYCASKKCGKKFSGRPQLKFHMRTQTGRKTFSCKNCEKSFSYKFNLKKHRTTHTGE